MQKEAAFTLGFRTIEQDCTLDNTIESTIIVMDGATVTINGHLTEHVTMLKGSTVYLFGSVDGTISNQGGTLYIFGEVRGALELEGGRTIIDAGSTIACIKGGRKPWRTASSDEFRVREFGF